LIEGSRITTLRAGRPPWRAARAHDPEKSLPSDLIRGWEPVSRQDHAQTN
jgi:hypothetical protein